MQYIQFTSEFLQDQHTTKPGGSKMLLTRADNPSTAASGSPTITADHDASVKPQLTSIEPLVMASSSPAPTAGPRVSPGGRDGLVNSPKSGSDVITAADHVALENFATLLTGSLPRFRASLAISTPAAAAHTSVTAGIPNPNAGGDAAVAEPQATSCAAPAGSKCPASGSAGRLCLATMGLLAAPGAGLLPGSMSEAAALGAAQARVSTAAIHHAAGSAHSRGSTHQGQGSAAVGIVLQGTAASAAGGNKQASTGVGGPRDVSVQQNMKDVQQAWCRGSHAAAVAVRQVHRDLRGTTPAGVANCSNVSTRGAQLGTAAFRTTSREQACRIGRVSVMKSDTPGPAHYRPAQRLQQKHVPSIYIAARNNCTASAVPDDGLAAPSSAAASTASPRQQQVSVNAGKGAVTAAVHAPPAHAAVAAARAAAARGSVTDSTPLSEGDVKQGKAFGLRGHRMHARQKVLRGTSAFLAVSREQRERQGGCGCPAPALEQSTAAVYPASEATQLVAGAPSHIASADNVIRPRSGKGPATPFSKQTPRAAYSVVTDCPVALGPGAYYRNGQLPCSYTGAGVTAGHLNTTLNHTPDFRKTSSRPGTCPAVLGGNRAAVGDAEGVPALDWPGLWGWATAAEEFVDQPEHLTGHVVLPVNQQQRQPSCSYTAIQAVQEQVDASEHQAKQRPSSCAALSYARSQLYTLLAAEESTRMPDPHLATGCTIGLLGQQQKQKQPMMVATHQQRVMMPGGVLRPASAGAVLAVPASSVNTSSSVLEAYWLPAGTCSHTSSSRSSNCRIGDGILGLQELQRYSSAGLAPRIKGGGFSTGSRAAASRVLRAMSVGSTIPPASVPDQPGTELSYEPHPEVQGHMHRSPGWSLPPNRAAISKAWAQLAQGAAMQQ